MKKVILLVVVGATTLVSCKKDYTCACTAGTDSATYAAKDYTYSKVTKKTATANCEAQSKTFAIIPGVSCKLK
jgi:hypothetical protein